MALKLSATPFSATPFSALGLVIMFVVVAVAASAASEEGGDQGDCTGPLMRMMPCLDYITDPKAKAPPPTCCLELGQVLDSQPLCLCHILNGDVSKIIDRPIDKSRALALPGLCKLSTPPISVCKLAPLPPLTSAPLPPLSLPPLPPSGGGAQTAAAPAPLSSDGARQRWALPILVIFSVVYVFLF